MRNFYNLNTTLNIEIKSKKKKLVLSMEHNNMISKNYYERQFLIDFYRL